MLPRALPKAPPLNVVAMEFAAELQGVLARGVRNVIDELGDVVWALELRPFESRRVRGRKLRRSRCAAGLR